MYKYLQMYVVFISFLMEIIIVCFLMLAGSQRLLATPTGVHGGFGYDLRCRDSHSAIVA